MSQLETRQGNPGYSFEDTFNELSAHYEAEISEKFLIETRQRILAMTETDIIEDEHGETAWTYVELSGEANGVPEGVAVRRIALVRRFMDSSVMDSSHFDADGVPDALDYHARIVVNDVYVDPNNPNHYGFFLDEISLPSHGPISRRTGIVSSHDLEKGYFQTQSKGEFHPHAGIKNVHTRHDYLNPPIIAEGVDGPRTFTTQGGVFLDTTSNDGSDNVFLEEFMDGEVSSTADTLEDTNRILDQLEVGAFEE